MDRLRRIVANLLRHVPDPPKAEPRATASFAGLKVGQRLRDALGYEWVVTSTDSQGYEVLSDAGTRARFESREWKEHWSRVRAPRKRKGTALPVLLLVLFGCSSPGPAASIDCPLYELRTHYRAPWVFCPSDGGWMSLADPRLIGRVIVIEVLPNE